MNCITRFIGGFAGLLWAACAPCPVAASGSNVVAAEFIGSTPCDTLAREFLDGLPTNAPCHCITWKLTLATNKITGQPTTFSVAAQYQVPTPRNPNRSQHGPKVESRGTWETVENLSPMQGGAVYRLNAKRKSLSFVQVGERLLHALTADGRLMVGTGGWSHTLNRADHAENAVDAALAATAPDMSYKIAPVAEGPGVFGVFEGRSPCHGIARELNIPQHPASTKVKWRITLYQDPQTLAATTYKVEGSLHRRGPREGRWSIARGAQTDSNATVYRLEATQTEAALSLLRGDENVLFFLDQKGAPMTGHAEFSYTLNRVAKPRDPGSQ